MSNKSPSQIVSRPRLWPASFTKPEVGQKVCIKTYIFKNGTDIQKFVKFVEDSFPNYKIDIKQNEDGSTSVSLARTTPRTSNYTNIQYYITNVSNYPGTCKLNSSTCTNTATYIYKKELNDGGFLIWKQCDCDCIESQGDCDCLAYICLKSSVRTQ